MRANAEDGIAEALRSLPARGSARMPLRCFGRLAQLGEHQLDKLGVTGSSPVPPIEKPCKEAGTVCCLDDNASRHGNGCPTAAPGVAVYDRTVRGLPWQHSVRSLPFAPVRRIDRLTGAWRRRERTG